MPKGNPAGYNKARSMARGRTASAVAGKVKASPKATAAKRAATVAKKVSDKPKATGRGKKVPTITGRGYPMSPPPAMTTNKRKKSA